ncbi:hypothetical protein Sste5346_009906 [Sporothrix stenoceras]|uniref:Major facilitator superfamily (MFS) profile domain-containing protein n=1 Tax=Sporothrix stenoceras TaxID=5173 RepID=A0ABR3YJ68_9PEZI
MKCFWSREPKTSATQFFTGSVPASSSSAEKKDNGVLVNEAPVYELDAVLPSVDNENAAPVDAAPIQAGVRKVEEAAQTWSRAHIVLAYILIWIILFTDALQQNMSGTLTPYVTSSFSTHSLTAATGVMASVIGGLAKLPLAKVLDIWGRPQGFAMSVVILDLGLIMMAACQDVKGFAAAQVFYWVGFNGLTYSLQIFIADTSALEMRALAFAFSTSPFLATTFAGGPLATAFMRGPGWRWAFGTFSVVTPLVCAPLMALFAYNGKPEEDKEGEQAIPAPERTFLQSLKHYAIEFDLFGMLLVLAGLALFLLPFSIYSYQKLQWRSPMILTFLGLGVFFLVAFAIYEKYWAPITLIPFELLTDRTVLGSCAASGAVFVSFFIWDNFFTSFLQVVNGLSMTQASYVANIYNLGTCFFSFVIGALVRCTGRFKWLALWFGVPVNALGLGLMIHFRQPNTPVGFVVMCQILISFAGGAMVICDQMALMASVPHQYLAVGLALENMFANIGGGIGASIAAGIWTGIFPKKLEQYLPATVSKSERAKIYGDLAVQLSFEKGSPIRVAIEHAYGDAQRYMLIAATAIMGVAFVAVLVWKDLRVKDMSKARIQAH